MVKPQLINIDEITHRQRTPLTVADVDVDHADRFVQSGMNFEKDLQLKGNYCYHPFNSVTIDTRGECYVCVCQAWLPISVGNILDFNSLTEIVHSPRAREIQASILDGTYKYCDHNTCHLITRNELETRIDHRPDTVNWIVFAIDDSCNLTCPSCRTGMIFHNKGEEFEHRMRVSTHITRLIQEHQQFLRFTLSGDGDPFASHVYRNILENLKLEEDDPIEIEIVTNGILAKSHWDRMEGIHKHVVRFKISFDAGTPETYAVTRRGGDWDKLIESSEYIIKWKQKHYSKMEVVANFVLQTANYKDIHNYVKLTDQLGFDEISFQKVVDWGKWTSSGVNYFVEHAVWMDSHLHYQDLIKLLNDPIMDNKKVKLTNLTPLKTVVYDTETLSELTKLKINLHENLKIATLQDPLSKLTDLVDSVPAEISAPLSDTFNGISKLLAVVDDQVATAIKKINNKIEVITQNYHTRGYRINGHRATDRTNVAGEEFRVLQIEDSTRELVISQISKYISWEYPGLEIGPGEGVWTSHLVACEPLYLIDIHPEFLEITKNKFTPEYRRKICSYVTSETDLSAFPQNQMGFVFSWNVFNYLTLDLIDQYLGQIFKALRPGGVAMFSYNNAERYHCAKHVEEGFMSYAPKALLLNLVNKHGFEIISAVDADYFVSWVEIRKPGQLVTIKRHASVGTVIYK